METRIEVFLQKGINDREGEAIKNDIQDLGIKKVKRVKTAQIYLIEGKISQSQTRTICQDLLIDPLIQEYQTTKSLRAIAKQSHEIATSSALKSGLLAMTSKFNPWIVEVWFKKGVTDTVAESAAKGIRDMGIKGVKNVRTGKKHLLFGSLSPKEVEIICQRLLANSIIQNYSVKKNE